MKFGNTPETEYHFIFYSMEYSPNLIPAQSRLFQLSAKYNQFITKKNNNIKKGNKKSLIKLISIMVCKVKKYILLK